MLHLHIIIWILLFFESIFHNKCKNEKKNHTEMNYYYCPGDNKGRIDEMNLKTKL